MKWFSRAAILVAALFSVAMANPASAQNTSIAQQSAYVELYNSMKASLDNDQYIDGLLATLARQLVANNPDLASAEQEHPGLVAAMAKAMRPTIVSYSERVVAEYEPRMIAALAEVLTSDEAHQAAQFYGSPIGRRVMGAASGGFQGARIIDDAIAGENIEQSSITRDLNEAGRRAMMSLSDAEMADFMRELQSNPALSKMDAVQKRVMPLRAEMENAPLTPAEQTQLETAVVDAAIEFMAPDGG